MSTLRDLGEFETIRRLVARRPPGTGVVLGPGDDAAVLRPAPGCDLVVTTDGFVEGRHWHAGWMTDRDLGARFAAANLSDLAAMGAAPRWALLTMGLGPDHEVDSLAELEAGLTARLAADGAALVGGNFSAVEGPEWMALTLIGEVAAGGAWARTGARPGDVLAMTGSPGRAGAGVRLALRHGPPAAGDWWLPLHDAWRSPASRVALARELPAGAVRAAIDVSDGLGGDLGHLCEAGGCGARLARGAWQEDALLARAAAELGLEPAALRFGPSDDYELVLALDPAAVPSALERAAAAGVPLRVIGEVTARGGIECEGPDGTVTMVEPRGYDHYR